MWQIAVAHRDEIEERIRANERALAEAERIAAEVSGSLLEVSDRRHVAAIGG